MQTTNCISPRWITHNRPNEIFVFGSNFAGHHAGGVARLAMNWVPSRDKALVCKGKLTPSPTMFDSAPEIKPYIENVYLPERFLIKS
jgi:hypothetical protein